MQQDVPRVWNKGSDINPHTLAVLTAYNIILQCNMITQSKLLYSDTVRTNQNRIITISNEGNKHTHQ